MADTERDLFVSGVYGQVSSLPFSDGKLEAKRVLRRRKHTLTLAADGATGTAISEYSIVSFPSDEGANGVRVVAAYVVPDSTVSYNGTNYGTITISARDGAGGNAATVATVASNVADWTAFVQKAFTVTAANALVAAGGLLTLTQTKAAAGVQFPTRHIVVITEAV